MKCRRCLILSVLVVLEEDDIDEQFWDWKIGERATKSSGRWAHLDLVSLGLGLLFWEIWA